MSNLKDFFKEILVGYYQELKDETPETAKKRLFKEFQEVSSGNIYELIYYQDTEKIFKDFEDEILDILDEYDISINIVTDRLYKTTAVQTAYELLFSEIYEEITGLEL